MARSKVTMQDLAKYCNVSTATISRVLNNNGRFSEETRKTVETAIRDLGYIPNDAAKSLRKQSTKLVGIFINTFDHEIVTDALAELQRLLFEHGFTPIICNIGSEAERENDYFQMLQRMNVCGIFMLFLRTAYKSVKSDSPIPTIFIYKNPETYNAQEDHYIIETDDFQAGELAARELIRCGCRRPALARFTSPNKSIPLGRQIGFLNGMYRSNIPLDESLSIVIDSKDYQRMYAVINEQIEKGQVADGYFCVNDLLATCLIRVLEKHKYRVPEDVRVVGCNNMRCSIQSTKPITTISHQITPICEAGVDLLEHILRGDEIPPEQRQQTFGVTLIRRETT